MTKLILHKKATVTERGTASPEWIIGSGGKQKVSIIAAQPHFDAYLTFDPKTASWYAVGDKDEHEAFVAGTHPPLNGIGAAPLPPLVPLIAAIQALTAKMDVDSGLTFTDYATISAGLSTFEGVVAAMKALTAKLDVDSGATLQDYHLVTDAL